MSTSRTREKADGELFKSTGIDDNATSTKVTVSNTGVGLTGSLEVSDTQTFIYIKETDVANKHTRFMQSAGSFYISTVNDNNSLVSGSIGINNTTNDVTLQNGNLVIGTNGKGIDFSANADSSATGASTTSELLDDYEEGTWTPVFGRNGGTQPTVGYSEQVGSYTKVGNMVFLTGDVGVNSISIPQNGALTITGMPFTKASAHYPTGSFTTSQFYFNRARSQLVFMSNTQIGFLGQANSTGSGNWDWEMVDTLDGNESIRFAITYQV